MQPDNPKERLLDSLKHQDSIDNILRVPSSATVDNILSSKTSPRSDLNGIEGINNSLSPNDIHGRNLNSV